MIKLSNFIHRLKNSNISGYGASCGSTVLIHYYNLTNKLKLLLDDERRRNNLFSPSTNIPVKNPNKHNLSKIDVIIIIAWRYKKNIINNIKKKFFNFYKKIKIFQILPNIKNKLIIYDNDNKSKSLSYRLSSGLHLISAEFLNNLEKN